MQKDGLEVAKHVKDNVVTGKVGVHGVSLGGSVANYIASNIKLDFVFIDRSFQSLESIAYWFGGIVILWVFKIFTLGGWPDNSLQNYKAVRTGTYKLISCDPNDAIVTDITSVKSGLALNTIKHNLE